MCVIVSVCFFALMICGMLMSRKFESRCEQMCGSARVIKCGNDQDVFKSVDSLTPADVWCADVNAKHPVDASTSR